MKKYRYSLDILEFDDVTFKIIDGKWTKVSCNCGGKCEDCKCHDRPIQPAVDQLITEPA